MHRSLTVPHVVVSRYVLRELLGYMLGVFFLINVLCMLSQFSSRHVLFFFFLVQALFAIMITRVGHGKWINSFVFVLKLQENKIKAYFAFTKQPLVLFHSHFSVYLFYLRYYLNKQLSGRDIICVPNALFISDRDFVQSFESRHGRHGNSNLVILFVSERNNHCSRIIKYKRNKQTNKNENISKRKIIYRLF